MPDDIWDVVESCWRQQFQVRPTFEHVVENLKNADSSA